MVDINSQGVLLDSNFLYKNKGRPIVLHRHLANYFMMSANNDTAVLVRNNKIDYSLLVIVDLKTQSLRFGIIDYL